VRNKETGYYFTDKGTWVKRWEDATDWPNIVEIAELCQKYNLHDVELVLEFETREFDVVMDLCTQTDP
jgi:hypothetical protein